MPGDVHGVVQKPHDANDAFAFLQSKQDEVTFPTAMARDMKRLQAGQNVVTLAHACSFRVFG
jgi:hypothetical protein